MKMSAWIAGYLLVFSCELAGKAQNLVAAGASAAQGARAIASVSERIVREIRDLHTGTRWVVRRSLQNPAGPGRMVVSTAAPAKADPDTVPAMVIRAGDLVAVEERTPAVDATLEAVALDAAPAGGEFEARLRIGGKMVRAVALAPGRAALAPSAEGRP